MKKIGCSTAKNVLAMGREKIIREADLEESTVDEVLAILRYEFEEDDDTDMDRETDIDADMELESDTDASKDTDSYVAMDTEMDGEMEKGEEENY